MEDDAVALRMYENFRSNVELLLDVVSSVSDDELLERLTNAVVLLLPPLTWERYARYLTDRQKFLLSQMQKWVEGETRPRDYPWTLEESRTQDDLAIWLDETFSVE